MTIIGGDSPKAGNASMRLGMDILLAGLGLKEAVFKRAITTLRSDHLAFSSRVQDVLHAALQGSGVTF